MDHIITRSLMGGALAVAVFGLGIWLWSRRPEKGYKYSGKRKRAIR